MTAPDGIDCAKVGLRGSREEGGHIIRAGWWEHPRELLKTMPLGNVLGCLRRLQELRPPQTGGYETFACAG